MKVAAAILLIGLVGDGDSVEPAEVLPECGATHCQITLAEAVAVSRMQQFSLRAYERQRDEIAALKRRASCRGGNT